MTIGHLWRKDCALVKTVGDAMGEENLTIIKMHGLVPYFGVKIPLIPKAIQVLRALNQSCHSTFPIPMQLPH